MGSHLLTTFRKHFRNAGVSLLIVVLSASFTMQPAYAFLFDSFGIKEEQELGRKFEVLVRANMPLVEDPEVKSYVASILERLSANIPPQPFTFTPNVILHKAVNAFAVPGGSVFVHTGLIMQMEHESELAAVMAHELAHVTQRHVAARMNRAKYTTLATLVGALAGAFLGRNSANGSGAAVMGSVAAGQASMLNYSRADETESDEIGLQYLVAAGYRPQGMVGAFEKIRKLQWATGLSMPEYLSTHPDVGSRVNEMSARVQSLPADVQGRPDTDARFSRVRTLIWARYGDPQQALMQFRGSDALSIMGQGMVASRRNKVAEATVLFDKALALAPKDALIQREAGTFHYSIGSNRAESLLRQALALDNKDAMARFFLARLMDDLKHPAEAQQLFKELLRPYPEDSEIHYYYGKSLGTSGRSFDACLHMAYSALYQNDRKKTEQWLERARQAASGPADKAGLEKFQGVYDERKAFWKNM